MGEEHHRCRAEENDGIEALHWNISNGHPKGGRHHEVACRAEHEGIAAGWVVAPAANPTVPLAPGRFSTIIG
jgi:hypothetical protein